MLIYIYKSNNNVSKSRFVYLKRVEHGVVFLSDDEIFLCCDGRGIFLCCDESGFFRRGVRGNVRHGVRERGIFRHGVRGFFRRDVRERGIFRRDVRGIVRRDVREIFQRGVRGILPRGVRDGHGIFHFLYK